jgi:hypothetical protein
MIGKYWLRCALLAGVLSAQLFASRGIAQAADCLSIVDNAGCQNGPPSEQYQSLLPIMEANPTPGVRPLGADTDSIQQYSSPGHPASSFTGVLVDTLQPYPMAWIITSNRPSAVPGQPPDSNTSIVPRYSRVYIFDTQKVKGWKWYLIGPGPWIQQTHVAILVPPRKPDGVQGRWVAVDVWQQVLTAFQDDKLIFTTLISSGKPSHPTRQGLHQVWIRLPTDDMNSSMGEPDFYALPYVPFVMYFDHSISLHGAYWHDSFGIAVSHGCVNMSLTDAHWLYNWSESTPNLPVYVWSSR